MLRALALLPPFAAGCAFVALVCATLWSFPG